MIVFHVTEARNLRDINAYGVDPEFSQGKIKASWWVVGNRLAWAIAHVCNRHHVTPDQVVILPALIEDKLLVATCYPGVFYIREVVYLQGRLSPKCGSEYLTADDRLPEPGNV